MDSPFERESFESTKTKRFPTLSKRECLAVFGVDVENESKTHIFQNQRIKKRESSDAEAIVSSGAFGKPQL